MASSAVARGVGWASWDLVCLTRPFRCVARLAGWVGEGAAGGGLLGRVRCSGVVLLTVGVHG